MEDIIVLIIGIISMAIIGLFPAYSIVEGKNNARKFNEMFDEIDDYMTKNSELDDNV